jgi:hypothetical protein
MLKYNLKLLRFLVFGIGLLLIGLGNVYSQAVSVSLPSLTVQAGTSGIIPLTVGDLTGRNVTAFQFTINYDKNVLYLTGASTTGLAMTGGTDPVFNADTANGKLVVAWARATAISGSGTLVNLSAQYRAAGTSALAFPTSGTGVFMFNAGTPAASVTNGSVFVPSVIVNFGSVTGVGLNDTVLILINTETLTAAQNVLSFEFTATYDKNIINVIDAVTTGTLSAGGTIVSNPNNITGTVSVAWAHSTKITGSGTLVYLRARVVGRGTSTQAFTSFQYNTGTPTAGGLSATLVSANRKPVLTAVTAKTVAEGALLSFTVSATDPDGDAITFSFTSSPAAAGAAIGSTTGVFTWTPGYDQAGVYTVTYKATDALGLSDSSVSTITVTNVNRKPVFTAVAAQSAQAGNAYELVVEAVDPDGDAVTYSYVGTPPAGATFTAATRTFAWTPTAAQVGSYPLRFRAADAGGLADTLSVALTVTKINRAPVFVTQMPDTSARTHIAFSFRYTASDPDLDPIRFYLFGPPAGARIDSVTGVFSWTPVKAQIGVHDIVVLVSDGTVSTTSRVTKLTVTLNNTPPVFTAVPPDVTIREDSAYSFQYRGSDADLGDVLKFSLIVRPTGSTIDSVTGVFSWKPTFDQGRTAPYTVIVGFTDGYVTIRDTALITVLNVNRKPVFTQVLRDTMVLVEKLFSFKFIASDPDLDPINYFIISAPAGATINQLGTFFWTPTQAQRGVWWPLVIGVRDYADTVRTTSRLATAAVSVEVEGKVPTEYTLFQNYPNPFNPSTVIKYGIPKESMVSLKIFNSIGEEIATLVNRMQHAGYYKYEFDASKLNSGIYFYRLQAGDFVSIKKMMYIK